MSIEQQIENIALHKAYKAINDQIIPRLEKLESDSITDEKLEQVITDALRNSLIKERLQNLEHNLSTLHPSQTLIERIERLERDVEKEKKVLHERCSFISKTALVQMQSLERITFNRNKVCATKRELDRVSWLHCGLLIASFAASIFVNHFILG